MEMYKSYSGSLYGSYRQKKFTDVYESVTDFLADYKDCGIPTTISDSSAQTLFYLLYGSYGNDIVASSDIHRFKYKLFSIIFQYGPNWEKQLEIQSKLRGLSEDDIRLGSRQIYNTAQNPSTEPSTDTTDELSYINNQNVTKNQRGVLEGYATLLSLLRTDVTQEFLNRFRKLFLTIVQPEEPLLYITEVDNND
mgnify:CR=1 FL=1